MTTQRMGIILAATAAAISFAAPTPARGQSTNESTVAVTPGSALKLTEDQCKAFMSLAGGYIKDHGRANLSDDFVNALVDFAVKRKCTGPASIPTTAKEVDIFTAISGTMYRTQGVDLKKMGVVPVARTP